VDDGGIGSLRRVIMQHVYWYPALAQTRVAIFLETTGHRWVAVFTASDGRKHEAELLIEEILDVGDPDRWAREVVRYVAALWYPIRLQGRIGTRDRLEPHPVHGEPRPRRWHPLTTFRIGRHERPRSPIHE